VHGRSCNPKATSAGMKHSPTVNSLAHGRKKLRREHLPWILGLLLESVFRVANNNGGQAFPRHLGTVG